MKTIRLHKCFIKAVAACALLCGTATVQAQWTGVGPVGFSPGGNSWEHIFFDASNAPYVSFSNAYGQVMKYTDTGWAAVGDTTNITAGSASDSWSAIAPDGTVYFSYADGSNSSRAGVLQYSGGAWSSAGSGLSVGTANNTNVVVSSTGTPYISYLDNSTTPASLYVQQYTGGTWTVTGSTAVSTTGPGLPCLAIDSHDSLYIAYIDAATQNVVVEKFNGTSWLALDTPFSAQPAGGAYFLTLAIDRNNVPVVAYMSPYPMGPSVCVSKYNGTHFTTLGSPSFTPSCLFVALAIDHNNVPYVTYVDNSVGGHTSVMKYDSTTSAWTNVGTAGFSTNGAVYTTISIDANNNPYIAFLDVSDGGTTVMEDTVCTPATAATIAISDSLICKGSTDTLRATGTLNGATNWYWYTGSCSGALVDSGAALVVTPGDTTTYYVHGWGGCVLSDACTPVTVNVDSVVTPTVTASGMVLTSTAATGNQWYKNDTLIAGATGTTYTVTATGWYKATATNSNSCSSTSDSIFVSIPESVAAISQHSNINAYPSPFTDVINIDITGTSYDMAHTTVYITDITGRKVAELSKPAQQNVLSLGALPQGMYLVNVITPDGRQVIKITKQ